MRVRDKNTIYPYHLWKLRNKFNKTNLSEFIKFEQYRTYIKNNIDQSKASLEVLNFELIFKKPYEDLRKIYEILEIEEPFENFIQYLSCENASEENKLSKISTLQKLLYKTANL